MDTTCIYQLTVEVGVRSTHHVGSMNFDPEDQQRSESEASVGPRFDIQEKMSENVNKPTHACTNMHKHVHLYTSTCSMFIYMYNTHHAGFISGGGARGSFYPLRIGLPPLEISFAVP